MGAEHSSSAAANAHHKPTHAALRCKKCGAAYTAALLHDDEADVRRHGNSAILYGAHGQPETAFCAACHNTHMIAYQASIAGANALHDKADATYKPELVWDHRAQPPVQKQIGAATATGGGPGVFATPVYMPAQEQGKIVVTNPASVQYGYVTAADGSVIPVEDYAPNVPTPQQLYNTARNTGNVRHVVYPDTSTLGGFSMLFGSLFPVSQPRIPLPRLISQYQLQLLWPMRPSVPLLTVYPWLNPCQAVRYTILRDQPPSALPGGSLLAPTSEQLYYAVRKYMPLGPILHEPGTEGFWLVPDVYTQRIEMVAVFVQAESDVAVMMDYRGRVFVVTYEQFLSDTRRPFQVARAALARQYPYLFETSSGMIVMKGVPREYQTQSGVPQVLTTQQAALLFKTMPAPPEYTRPAEDEAAAPEATPEATNARIAAAVQRK
jgi:hypothetical protein